MPADQNIRATESVQKRALKIVFPAEESYTEALGQANLPTLQERREDLCYNKTVWSVHFVVVVVELINCKRGVVVTNEI